MKEAINSCPFCGSTDIKKEKKLMFEYDGGFWCNNCDTFFYNIEKKMQSEFYQAQKFLQLNMFDKADEIYDDIIRNTNFNELKSMCYYGKLLAFFKIKFYRDKDNEIKIKRFSKCNDLGSLKISRNYYDIINNDFAERYIDRLEEKNECYEALFKGEELDNRIDKDYGFRYALSYDGLSYVIVDGDDCNISHVIIPETYNGIPITAIGKNAFFENDMIKKIVIGKNIQVIEDGAFSECESLSVVVFNSCLERIGKRAFLNNYMLKEIMLPNSLRYLGEAAFKNCILLEKITIPDNVYSIENELFYKCSSLTKITLNENIISIGDGAFSCCSSLKKIVLPKSITKIGVNSFSNCEKLSNVVFSNNIRIIKFSAFYGCFNLKKLKLPSSLELIEPYAFRRCNIRILNIPDSLITIEREAFSDCNLLEMVITTKKSKLKYVKPYSFMNCNKLGVIILPAKITLISRNICESNDFNAPIVNVYSRGDRCTVIKDYHENILREIRVKTNYEDEVI